MKKNLVMEIYGLVEFGLGLVLVIFLKLGELDQYINIESLYYHTYYSGNKHSTQIRQFRELSRSAF